MSNPKRRVSGRIAPRLPTPRQQTLAGLLCFLMRSLGFCTRLRLRGDEEGIAAAQRHNALFVLWHNRLALSLLIYEQFVNGWDKDRRLAALVSASGDGALLAAVFEGFGVRPVRGSSSRRGAQALLELASLAEEGFDIAITPDGPRGPPYEVQPGIISLARHTGLPIIPVHCNTRWRVDLRSWDRFQFPLPLARLEVRFAAPMLLPKHDETPMHERQKQLRERMMAGTRD